MKKGSKKCVKCGKFVRKEYQRFVRTKNGFKIMCGNCTRDDDVFWSDKSEEYYFKDIFHACRVRIDGNRELWTEEEIKSEPGFKYCEYCHRYIYDNEVEFTEYEGKPICEYCLARKLKCEKFEVDDIEVDGYYFLYGLYDGTIKYDESKDKYYFVENQEDEKDSICALYNKYMKKEK